ncbi:hypothetical protein Glove_645g6 [Diversispora epigaea]|uniref:Restriction endonuclease domain-containing protein n=1 Tax=Diversispora epigaea TaxID=1348612 RepID=A0A397G7M5_9GLOM|nr:hypothetical protein Glove_645g6 [Diversispora epigaea]
MNSRPCRFLSSSVHTSSNIATVPLSGENSSIFDILSGFIARNVISSRYGTRFQTQKTELELQPYVTCYNCDSDTRTRSISTTRKCDQKFIKLCIPSVHETYELKKFRYYWWKTGIMHSKAKWEEATLPYELATDISFEAFAEQTDKHNIHSWWEWENGTVRVVEFPSGFHERGVGAITREINDATRNVKGTNADILSLGATTTRSHGCAKEADASFRPNQKPHVNAGGSDGGTRPWPNIVVEFAYSQSEADLKNKAETYWLQPGRAHDVIAIKIGRFIPPEIPSVMTAWHYCINNRTIVGALSPLMYEFGTIDRQGNQINLQPGQCVISIQIGCLYHGMQSTFVIPSHLLPNAITIDLYYVQCAILNY